MFLKSISNSRTRIFSPPARGYRWSIGNFLLSTTYFSFDQLSPNISKTVMNFPQTPRKLLNNYAVSSSKSRYKKLNCPWFFVFLQTLWTHNRRPFLSFSSSSTNTQNAAVSSSELVIVFTDQQPAMSWNQSVRRKPDDSLRMQYKTCDTCVPSDAYQCARNVKCTTWQTKQHASYKLSVG